MGDTMTAAQARRIALAAQGFARPRPPAVTSRHLSEAIRRVGLLQIDSVNVFERSHYLPMFARLGRYDKRILDRLTLEPGTAFTEYWAHEAAIIPVSTRPLWRWKMRALRDRDLAENAWVGANSEMLDWLRAELATTGPLPASAIQHDANLRRGPWWGWGDVKIGLELLFRWGEVVTAGRTRFERTYGLAAHVLPPEILDRDIAAPDAIRALVAAAAKAHGIGTVKDLADYYRLSQDVTRVALADLEDEGTVRRLSVDGWKSPAFLHADATVPRRITATAVLSPFDPVVWERARAFRLFDFHYRIEIYTPAHKRIYGYYSLPVLLDDRIVGRVDLKSDRKAGILRVQSAWTEEKAPPETAERLAGALRDAAEWQGLGDIEVMDRGDLAGLLAGALGAVAR